MKTTLRELKGIFNFNLDKLKKNIGTSNLDTEVTILEILNSNGIVDAIRALKTQEYKDFCLFNADVAESVLHFFEDRYPGDDRPRKSVEGIRLWYDGKITNKEIYKLRMAASNSADVYIDVDNNASTAAYYASYAARAAAYYASYVASSADKKWKEIEMMLRKHLKENLLDDELFKI